jgi:hypothetical protein
LPPANSASTRDWDAIAHDYAASALTVPDICALHNVSRADLYNRANLDGWIKRSAARRAAIATTVHRLPPSRPVKGGAALARRMLTALDHKMTEFETRMTAQAAAGSSATTAADSERDARTLNTLVRLFDKLKGFGAKASASKAGSRTAGKDSHDADRFRNDLARRLENLRDTIGG